MPRPQAGCGRESLSALQHCSVPLRAGAERSAAMAEQKDKSHSCLDEGIWDSPAKGTIKSGLDPLNVANAPSIMRTVHPRVAGTGHVAPPASRAGSFT